LCAPGVREEEALNQGKVEKEKENIGTNRRVGFFRAMM